MALERGLEGGTFRYTNTSQTDMIQVKISGAARWGAEHVFRMGIPTHSHYTCTPFKDNTGRGGRESLYVLGGFGKVLFSIHESSVWHQEGFLGHERRRWKVRKHGGGNVKR